MTDQEEESRSAILPAHIETTVAAIARLHAEHHKRATPCQRFTKYLTAKVGETRFVGWLTLFVGGWIVINVLTIVTGRQSFDAPPFAWLELLASLAALYMTALILSTQRRDDELAGHREQLTLELAILSDQNRRKSYSSSKRCAEVIRIYMIEWTTTRMQCRHRPTLKRYWTRSRPPTKKCCLAF